MSNVQIRDVPASVVDALKSAAAKRGQSLQRYLVEVLTEQARIATTTAVLDEAAANARRAGAGSFDSVALVREGRDARDAELTTDVPDPRRR
ncbi:MAG: FitA-like ribbon-helix-helix domain-containing protein [Pseudonocardiaceae bacterium]